MLAASRQSFALCVYAFSSFRIVWLILLTQNSYFQCARRRSPVFGLALPHEQVHQDARQHCLVLCSRLNCAWSASICRHAGHQCRLCYLRFGSVCRLCDPNHCTVDMEEGEWMDARNIFARCMGECASLGCEMTSSRIRNLVERTLRVCRRLLDGLHVDRFPLPNDGTNKRSEHELHRRRSWRRSPVFSRLVLLSRIRWRALVSGPRAECRWACGTEVGDATRC